MAPKTESLESDVWQCLSNPSRPIRFVTTSIASLRLHVGARDNINRVSSTCG